MKKTIVLVLAVVLVLVLGGCGGNVSVTVNYTGTEYDGTLAVYLAIADGYALSQTTLNDFDVIDLVKITPSETEQTHVFMVPKNSNYTVFVFHDLNTDGAYDVNDTVRISLDSAISYLEEDVTVSIDYNY